MFDCGNRRIDLTAWSVVARVRNWKIHLGDLLKGGEAEPEVYSRTLAQSFFPHLKTKLRMQSWTQRKTGHTLRSDTKLQVGQGIWTVVKKPLVRKVIRIINRDPQKFRESAECMKEPKWWPFARNRERKRLKLELLGHTVRGSIGKLFVVLPFTGQLLEIKENRGDVQWIPP